MATKKLSSGHISEALINKSAEKNNDLNYELIKNILKFSWFARDSYGDLK